MHLTLFVPDLLWPDVDQATAFDVPGTSAVARVLATAQRTEHPMSATDSWESALARLFGFDHPHPPLAWLRARGDGIDMPDRSDLDAIGLCADPVSLDFVQQSLVLFPTTASTLSARDISSLLASLNEEFRGEGHFVAATAPALHNHWYFIPENTARAGNLPDLAACSRLAGRRIDADDTRQILGRENLQWLNRIQMCLNEHPVNLAREAQGLTRINSLWPWGGGSIITPATETFASAAGESSLLKGLCLTTKTPLSTHPAFPESFNASNLVGDHLITEHSLSNAVLNDDLSSWQAALQQLDHHLITPALGALSIKTNSLQTLRLISPDAHRVRCWTLDRTTLRSSSHWLKRWLGIKATPPTLGSLVRSW